MNVSFSPTICEDFLKNLGSNADYEILRQAAERMGVPSLGENACTAVTNIVSIKQPSIFPPLPVHSVPPLERGADCTPSKQN